MGTNANACVGNVGEPCGWTTTNEAQGYTCQTVSFGTGCEPGGTVCPGGGSTSGSSSSVASSSSSTSSGTPTGGLASILSEAQFDGFFPDRNAFYTYQGLVAATAMYPSFANSGNATTDRQEVAAFLANVAHETGSLVYVDEIAQAPYCMAEPGCGCGGGEYYGRGPLQISWNYNYCAAGSALGVDLVDDPDLVSTDATITWQTALWFWMTSTGAGSETCHAAIDGGAGFGQTIQVINGSLECNGGDPADVQDRVSFYEQFCGTLGVSPGNDLTC
jgi:predicted chitinase